VTASLPALVEAADRLCDDPAFRDAVWRHLTHRRPQADASRLRTRIHPGDQMLRHSLRHWGDANFSVSQYYGVALQQHHAARQLLALVHPGGTEGLAILDFACGWGRLLRFLTHSVPPAQVWASEIQPEAVRFVREEYGVSSVPSAFDPAAFRPGRAFDFIWVASLFSHLPDALFQQWLARLIELLTPSGVLCFSVIGERLLPANVPMPATGIHFVNASEIEELDNRAYGTSFVTEAYVRGAIAAGQGTGTGHAVRIRQALANEQDLYVVPRDPGRDLSVLAGFRRGAWGWVDQARFEPGGTLRLAGWAAALDEGPAEGVEIRVDGERFDARVDGHRGDVAEVLGDARLATSGWAFERDFARPRVFVEASARSRHGDRALLYAGWLGEPA
jgi:2-polyprenyl-3-methyl-5-hydroxy-6-metoxy-1,4-benzoquinol methylase